MRPRLLLMIAAGVALIAIVAVGLSKAPKVDTSPKASAFSLAKAQASLAGSPAKLDALHRQASKLLPGAKTAVERYSAIISARLAGRS